MTKSCPIIIDCRLQIHYSSYYFIGFDRLGFNYSFGIIEDLPICDKSQLMRGAALTFQKDSLRKTRVFIDTQDLDNIDEAFYNWADIYAKVNLRQSDTKLPKVFAIGPNFGVRVGGVAYTLMLGGVNYLRSLNHYPANIKPSFREFMHGYLYSLFRRRSIEAYEQDYEEDRDYVFTMNTLWYDKNTDTTTNTLRGYFALYCKKAVKFFEGGFFYINQKTVVDQFPEYTKYLEKYKDIITHKRVSSKQYIKNTRRSAFVFNTPSVSGCHGWKFGEYLTMGKAIISTSIKHEMPGRFAAGYHYLLANSEEEIGLAIERLLSDPGVCNELKKNAKYYYSQYLAPEAVVARIISEC